MTTQPSIRYYYHHETIMKSDPNNKKSISALSRARRTRQFIQRITSCNISSATILDIGGTLDFWKMNSDLLPNGLIKEIDVVNLPPHKRKDETINGIVFHLYEGNALDRSTLRLKKYDVVHSNSVIEHVGNLTAQLQMAHLIRQIAKYYWIQTPAKTFPLEPHFYFPFFAYLPLSVRSFLYRNLELGFMGCEPDWLKSRIACEETRLLIQQELICMFPESEIIKERLFLLVKSLIVTNMVNK